MDPKADAQDSLRFKVARQLFSLAKARDAVDDTYRKGFFVVALLCIELGPEGTPITLGVRSSLSDDLLEDFLKVYFKASREQRTWPT